MRNPLRKELECCLSAIRYIYEYRVRVIGKLLYCTVYIERKKGIEFWRKRSHFKFTDVQNY